MYDNFSCMPSIFTSYQNMLTMRTQTSVLFAALRTDPYQECAMYVRNSLLTEADYIGRNALPNNIPDLRDRVVEFLDDQDLAMGGRARSWATTVLQRIETAANSNRLTTTLRVNRNDILRMVATYTTRLSLWQITRRKGGS
jgi:hypothetical protein